MVELYLLAGVGTIVFAVAARSAVKVVWRKLLRPKAKGHQGEAKVRKTLKHFSRRGARAKNDILIPNRRGTTQIDHVLVTRQGVFVIETKNYSGIIDGSPNGNMWRQTFPNSYMSPRHFYNPILQNEGHIRALQDIVPDNIDIPFHSIVAFGPDCVFPRHPGVICTNELKAVLKTKCAGPAVLTDQQVDEICAAIGSYEINDKKDRKKHNVRAGLHSSREEVEAFIAQGERNSMKLDVSSPTSFAHEAKEGHRRHQLTDIYAKVTIRGRTDTIDTFFEKAKRNKDGTPVPPGGKFDYFICPYTGDKFPASEAINFYQGLWISYLNKNPELVSFMKEYGAANLGNSYRCKKVLSLYDSDKEALTKKIKETAWYQNMVKKQSRPSLNHQIQNAENRTQQGTTPSQKCDREH